MKLESGKIKVYISIVIVFCIIIIACYLFATPRENTKENKQIVETNQSKSPSIDLMGKDISTINNKIKEMYDFSLLSSENTFDYQHAKGEDLFSFVAINSYYEDDATKPTYRLETFNIDLSTGTLLSKEKLYEKYQITDELISNVIEDTMKFYYEDEIKEGYLTDKCDYDCFLTLRGVDKNNYSENAKIYIGEDTVFVYKTFDIVSSYADEGYYLEPIEAFRFFVK